MIKKGFVWECECGQIEHGIEIPEDCSKCLAVGKFDRVPDDLIEDKMAGAVLSLNPTEEDDEDDYEEI